METSNNSSNRSRHRVIIVIEYRIDDNIISYMITIWVSINYYMPMIKKKYSLKLIFLHNNIFLSTCDIVNK